MMKSEETHTCDFFNLEYSVANEIRSFSAEKCKVCVDGLNDTYTIISSGITTILNARNFKVIKQQWILSENRNEDIE